MIDERHYIYSIAAVFFALAVGIAIGTSMARAPAGQGAQTTIRQYEKWMNNLRGEVESHTKETSRMAQQAKKNEEFCQAALPLVARDRLAWRSVAILRTGDSDDLTGPVKRALELAGAQVTSVTEISRNFPFDDDQKIREVLANCGVWLSPDAEKPSDKLWKIIASAVSDGRRDFVLTKLQEAGVAKFTGKYDKPSRLIVLVGGASGEDVNTSESVDCEIIAQLNKPSVTIVGCESTSAGCSFVPAWQKMGIATVDNTDTAIGQISLICALNGERASFGLKDTADRVVPQTLESR